MEPARSLPACACTTAPSTHRRDLLGQYFGNPGFSNKLKDNCVLGERGGGSAHQKSSIQTATHPSGVSIIIAD